MADQYYDKVSLLLPMSGANNGTTFTDWSAVPKTVAAVGNAKTSTAQSKYYGSSGLFDGTGDYLSIANHADFNFAAVDFSVMAWVLVANITQFHPICGQTVDGSNGWLLDINSTGYPRLVGYLGAWGVIMTSSVAVTANAWTHLEVCRSGNNLYLFVDGVQRASTTSSSSFADSAAALRIGYFAASGGDRFLNGYIQDVRIHKGAALNTTDFTPPTALIKTLSGTVKDDTNANAIRTVRAYPRLTGAPMASTTSASDGTWSLSVPDTEHSIICLDDSTGTIYNDLIYRATPV